MLDDVGRLALVATAETEAEDTGDELDRRRRSCIEALGRYDEDQSIVPEARRELFPRVEDVDVLGLGALQL